MLNTYQKHTVSVHRVFVASLWFVSARLHSASIYVGSVCLLNAYGGQSGSLGLSYCSLSRLPALRLLTQGEELDGPVPLPVNTYHCPSGLREL